ncbi:hypothetical protein APA_3543 [Pseudanabaena sp. lw0831]|uniref:pentapeptide repeat-containing protein n=1 Tax=Pseudanabaena sp. lw0831 TaxID=1357935 RepID=UPI0019157F07|nr:pentapeptide repeat-containing protein [Pseudanabaena sp. lw0831]GBO55392.1 hypothetical protein APA_3543 [Pseudanabaena sp. lw0831]
MNSLNYTNQNLQDQSFVGLDLTGADFGGADLRGCDFTRATLIGANFERVITGKTSRQVNMAILSVIMGAIAMILFGFAIVMIDSLLFSWLGDIYRKISRALVSIIPFVLILFQNPILGKFPQITSFFGEVSLGLIFAVMILLTLGLTIISFTSSLLFLIPAIVSAIVTFYLGRWLIESMQSRDGTSFQKANLTDANFSHALIENTDFSFALLTGICVDGWMLDSHTLFTNSQCDYLYWNPQRERFPHDNNFQADELKKFLSKFIKAEKSRFTRLFSF